MLIKFWGVRGSTPTPQPENMRYGGNTPCVEVRLNGHLYIFDCGTGFRNLGKHLLEQAGGRPIEAHVFISHFHWDHIQGIPFFAPLYEGADNLFLFHSFSRSSGFREALEGQMVTPYFPVEMGHMAANRSFYNIGEGQIEFDDCLLRTCWLNHPQGCLGFRLESSEGTFVYATDNEPGVKEYDQAVRQLAEGADVLVYDAQYTPEEYESKRRHWGHSHWREAVSVAHESGVRKLILFHHDPDHTDLCIDSIVEEASAFHPAVCAAAEGMEVSLAEQMVGMATR